MGASRSVTQHEIRGPPSSVHVAVPGCAILAAKMPRLDGLASCRQCDSIAAFRDFVEGTWSINCYGPVMIIWLNGTHGVGKTTTSRFLQDLVSDARIFDAEKVGETLMDVTPGLPATDNFQHWPPWRPLVVETARQLLDYVGGTVIVPMTVLTEQYWQEINGGLRKHGIDVHHFVLHVEESVLRTRIDSDPDMEPSAFRHQYVAPYIEAADAWLHAQAAVIDTTHEPPSLVAQQIAQRIG